MLLKPVNAIKNNYPTIEHYIENPAQLIRYAPASWNRKVLISWMLAGFVLAGSGSGCTITKPPIHQWKPDKNKKNKDDVVKGMVAPIFAHGKGAGVIGCVAIAGPVFISESEARELIFNTLKNFGFSVEDTSIIMPINTKKYNEQIYLPEKDTIQLHFDCYVKDLNLIIDFVSGYDSGQFEAPQSLSINYYNPKKVAELKREIIKDSTSYNAVFFYDPMVIAGRTGYFTTTSRETAQEEARRLLLAQVNDFIVWLKVKRLID